MKEKWKLKTGTICILGDLDEKGKKRGTIFFM